VIVTTSTGKVVEFAVSGTGQAEAALLAVSPSLLTFEGIAVGGHVTDSATLSNVGAQPLTIENVKLPAAPFTAGGVPVAGQKLAPGASITVSVAFDPTSEGEFRDDLTLETSGGTEQVGLSGRAGSPANLQLSGEAVDYGSVAIGGTLTKSFTVTNTGGTAATITKSKPPSGGAFIPATMLTEGETIQPGESVTEQVTFAPTEPGPASGVWEINGDDTSGLHQVAFTGTGTYPAPAGSGDPVPGTSSQGLLASLTEQGVLTHRPGTGPDAELAGTALHVDRHGLLRARVRCQASARVCIGTIVLRSGRAASAHGKRSSGRVPAAIIATGSFTVPRGAVRTVKLHLSQRALTRLLGLGVMRGVATLLAHDRTGAKHTSHASFTLRPAA